MPDATGVVDKNAANKTQGKHIHNYSTFDRSLSYRLYNTHRFGDYTPTFVMEGVPKDEIRLNSLDHIDSLSLKAPFKGSIRKIKETFMVPNMAILPLQWDRIYAQPSNGDDVPNDANCILLNFPNNFSSLFLSCHTKLNTLAAAVNSTSLVASFMTAFLRTAVLGEYVYSAGSLLNVLGYKGNAQVRWLNVDQGRLFERNFDDWYDAAIQSVFDPDYVSLVYVIEPVGGSTRVHQFSIDPIIGTNEGYENLRQMIELFRENPLCYVQSWSLNSAHTASDYYTLIQGLTGAYQVFGNSSSIFKFWIPDSSYTGDVSDITSLNPNVLNLTRILSYQLICAHFYSNSSVDFLYSADLYRQYIDGLTFLLLQTSNYSAYARFTWNGQQLLFDYLSGHFLNLSLCLQTSSYKTNFVAALDSTSSQYLYTLPIWSAIFGYRKSLRYGDYFTASRPRPLAPINTDVAVNSNLVSVIDITRNIQAQRFANAVMRSRSKIEEYVKSLFGSAPAPDFHNPFFLTRSEEIVFGDYVQNTANNQSVANSRSANFAANLDRHTFTFHNDDMHPCIYMQIVSYDTPRAYTKSVDRQFLHIDRFDMFNPDFQYIGDQAIYGIELGYHPRTGYMPNIFGYQSRDMEYKQRFDVASAGFVSGALPGWCFSDQKLDNLSLTQIGPDFIRSRNSDLDYLYIELSGFSLANYFHFTCVTDNNISAKRAMAVDPQILA